jgi:hypothetical protein
MKNLYILLLVFFVTACGSLMPSLPKVSTPTPVASTKTTQVMAETTANVWEWAWISIVLVFVFPSMRAPITGFLKALFFILALPLELAHKHVTMLYNKKFGSDKEENKNYTKK